MFIRQKRLNELLKMFYQRGYNQGFQTGELHEGDSALAAHSGIGANRCSSQRD